MKHHARLIVNIKRLMAQGSGQSAESLAFGAKISKSTLSRILNNKLSPTLRVMGKIADYYNVDAKDLLE